MRARPEPTLLTAEFCDSCALRDRCDERDSAHACGQSASRGRTVDVREIATFEQWLNWADAAIVPSREAAPVVLPPYFPTLPRGVPARAVRALEIGTIGFTLGDFGTHARRAEKRGVLFRQLVGANERRVVVLGADPDRSGIRAWQRW